MLLGHFIPLIKYQMKTPGAVCHFLRSLLPLALVIHRLYGQANVTAAIAQIDPVVTTEDVPVRNLPITIYTSDPQPDRFRLQLLSLSMDSLLEVGQLVFGGSGTNRNVTLVPRMNQSGTTGITIALMDGRRTVATNMFSFQVFSEDDPPVLGPIPNQTRVLGEIPPPIQFTVKDVDRGTYLFTFESSNLSMITSSGLQLTNIRNSSHPYYLNVTPIEGVVGSATIRVSVRSTNEPAAATSSQSFVLTVRPGLFGQSKATTQKPAWGPALIADFGGPRGLMLAEKSKIFSGLIPAIFAAH